MFEAYFRIRSWESPLYARLGVRRFQAWMLRGVGRSTARSLGWHPVLDREQPLRSALERFDRQTRRNEAAHLVALLVLGAICLKLLSDGDSLNAAAVAVINVPVNVYPLLLQRNHRGRIDRLVRRMNRCAD